MGRRVEIRRAVSAPSTADRELLASLDRDAERVALRAGPWLACRPGCDDCCRRPFPVTRLDARRLRQALERAEPARRQRIAARARKTIAAFRDGFPGDARTGRLVQDEAALDRFFELHRDAACPVLDPERGTCELYTDRPVACRIHGPPLLFGDERVPPCGHCFAGAPPAELEASRWQPDREGRERAILDEMGASPDESWHTLVAFAVSERPRGEEPDR